MKSALDGLISRLDKAEQRILECEDTYVNRLTSKIEKIQEEKDEGWRTREQNIQELEDEYKRRNVA